MPFRDYGLNLKCPHVYQYKAFKNNDNPISLKSYNLTWINNSSS